MGKGLFGIYAKSPTSRTMTNPKGATFGRSGGGLEVRILQLNRRGRDGWVAVKELTSSYHHVDIQ